MARPNRSSYSGERLKRAQSAYDAGQDYAGDLTYRTTRTEEELMDEAADGCMDMFMGDDFAAEWAYEGACDRISKHFKAVS